MGLGISVMLRYPILIQWIVCSVALPFPLRDVLSHNYRVCTTILTFDSFCCYHTPNSNILIQALSQ